MGWDLLCTLLSNLTARDGLCMAINDLSKSLFFHQLLVLKPIAEVIQNELFIAS